MKHTFTQDVLVINDAFTESAKLIEAINSTGGYTRATVSNSTEDYASEMRTNSTFVLNGKQHPHLAGYHKKLDSIIKDAVEIYRGYNPYLHVGDRTEGYDILRYEVGEKFVEHVDQIPGHAQFKNRQLSVLLYLNSDYEGGETVFRQQRFQLKPPAGTLALFPPFYTHPHASAPIVSGTKYAAVAWFYS